ncbi:MAG: hypothetical protein K8S87_01560 [Planctomycetes bacterium]|nr:hypothetical protein [Planctomycetota bacterium]
MKENVTFHFGSDNPIPWNEFQKILNSFQSAYYAIGDYSQYSDLPKSGRKSNVVMNDYSLNVQEIVKGNSYTAVFSLPSDLFTTAKEDLKKLVQVLEGIFNNSISMINALLPDSLLRKKVLNNLKDMSKKSQRYDLQIENVRINIAFESNVNEIVKATPTEEECNAIGIISEIRFLPTNHFEVLTENRGKRFNLTEEFKDTVMSNLEDVVTVVYRASINPETREETIENVLEIIPLINNVLEVSSIRFESDAIELSKLLPIQIEIEDDLWILKNDDLYVSSYGVDFVKAWQDFQENFIYQYKELVETDDKLSPKAEYVKEKLIEYVER